MRVIVTTMKDEGPFMLEWVAYHLSIGFDHFIINTNDCSDGTNKIAMRLQDLGIATHIDNPGPWKKGPQGDAYANAMAHPVFAKAEWILVSDADEFLNIKVGDGTLDALFAARPDANLFSFTWQLFGHNGIVEFRDAPVTEQFIRAADPYQRWPRMCVAFKTLYRADCGYSVVSTHRPKKLKAGALNKLNWVDGDGDDMTNAFAHFGWHSANLGLGFGNDLARMNHYATRSLHSYLMKRMRGDVRTDAYHKKLEETGVNYWTLHCWNSVENDSILRNGDRMRAALKDLKSDPALGQLHDAAVSHHRERIAALTLREPAKRFEEVFKDYVAGFDWVQGHDVVACPEMGHDTRTFDARRYENYLRSTREKELSNARKFRRLPWFVDCDATGIEFPAAGTLESEEALREAARDKAEKAVPFTRPKRRRARKSILRQSGHKGGVWAVLNSGDAGLIEDVLEQKNPEKLFVISSWGYSPRRHTIPINKRSPSKALVELDAAYLKLVQDLAPRLKSGKLSLYRADPYHALKILPKGYLNGAVLSGAMEHATATRLLRRIIDRTVDGGVLVTDSYHRKSAHGDDMIRALHDVMGEQPSRLRVQALDGAHLVLQVLASIE